MKNSQILISIIIKFGFKPFSLSASVAMNDTCNENSMCYYILLCEVQKWLRETSKIIVDCSIHGTNGEKCNYGYSIQFFNKRWFHKGNELEIQWGSYREALEIGLIEGLKLKL